MKTIFFIVFVQLNSGDFQISANLVETCPDDKAVQSYYSTLEDLGAFKRWSALCTEIGFPGKAI